MGAPSDSRNFRSAIGDDDGDFQSAMATAAGGGAGSVNGAATAAGPAVSDGHFGGADGDAMDEDDACGGMADDGGFGGDDGDGYDGADDGAGGDAGPSASDAATGAESWQGRPVAAGQAHAASGSRVSATAAAWCRGAS